LGRPPPVTVQRKRQEQGLHERSLWPIRERKTTERRYTAIVDRAALTEIRAVLARAPAHRVGEGTCALPGDTRMVYRSRVPPLDPPVS